MAATRPTGFGAVAKIVDKQSINPANVPTATSLAVAATVKGVRPGDIVLVAAPDLETNLVLGSVVSVTAVDTVTFRISNPTVGDINPAAQDFVFMVL